LWYFKHGYSNAIEKFPAYQSSQLKKYGTTLLYIDIDGYIRGFNILNAWSYQYFDFMKDAMVSQNITAKCCLIFPESDRIYYIGTYTPAGTNNVHGFQSDTTGSWSTVSPSYSAQLSVLGESPFFHGTHRQSEYNSRVSNPEQLKKILRLRFRILAVICNR